MKFRYVCKDCGSDKFYVGNVLCDARWNVEKQWWEADASEHDSAVYVESYPDAYCYNCDDDEKHELRKVKV